MSLLTHNCHADRNRSLLSVKAVLHLLVAAICPLSAVSAQGFNIDFQPTDRSVPGPDFGGAAGQAGVWMQASFPYEQTLISTNGAATEAKLEMFYQGAPNWMAWETDNTGDHAALLDDGILAGTTPCIGSTYCSLFLRGISNGIYRVYTYARWPDGQGESFVAVNGESEVRIAGVMPVNAFVEGVTHSVHEVSVTGGFIIISLYGGEPSWDTALCGLQIVPLELDGCSLNQQPADVTVLKERTATFSAAISGDVRSYQWTRDGVALTNGRGISGATSSTLTLAETRPSDNGVYALRYRCGGVMQGTAGATLSVIDCTGDLNGDGIVNLNDLTVLLTNFGQMCP